MQNNIKEIQEFVREKAIMAAHPECKTLEDALKLVARDEGWIDDGSESNYLSKNWMLTLPRVLLALPNSFADIDEIKTIKISIENRTWSGGPYFEDERKHLVGSVETVFECSCCEDFWTDIFAWDLTKKTFEQQDEKTQLAIAQLLGYKPTNMAESVETN